MGEREHAPQRGRTHVSEVGWVRPRCTQRKPCLHSTRAYLVELVLPHQPARVTTIGSGFGPKAWSQRSHGIREVGFGQDLPSEEVGQRDLSGGYQEAVLAVHLRRLLLRRWGWRGGVTVGMNKSVAVTVTVNMVVSI